MACSVEKWRVEMVGLSEWVAEVYLVEGDYSTWCRREETTELIAPHLVSRFSFSLSSAPIQICIKLKWLMRFKYEAAEQRHQSILGGRIKSSDLDLLRLFSLLLQFPLPFHLSVCSAITRWWMVAMPVAHQWSLFRVTYFECDPKCVQYKYMWSSLCLFTFSSTP